MRAMPVWVFMRMFPDGGRAGWEIMGVFSTRERAAAACTTDRDVIFTLTLDERLPDHDVPMKDVEWPCGNARGWSWDYLDDVRDQEAQDTPSS